MTSKPMRTALSLAALFLFFSCSNGEKGQKGAGEVMKDYSKTLSAAPQKARDAVEKTEQREDKNAEALKETER